MGKLADQLQAEALELILLDQLIQVDGEQLEGDADVVAEDEAIVQVNDVHLIVLVLLFEVLEDFDLLLGLPMKTRLIANHFQCHVDVVLVVVGFHHLTETALADDFEHLVAVGHVVVDDVDVRVLLVVVTRIVRRHDGPLFCHSADKVDVRIIEDLLAFVGCQYVTKVLEHLLRLSWLGFRLGHHSVARSVTFATRRRALLLRRWTIARHF